MAEPRLRSPALVGRAYGKVNLALEVLGRRQDGYHEVRTILQRIALYDTVRVRPGRRLTLRRWGGGVDDDLILRAASALRATLPAGHQPGARISLRKRIPVAAGLGGGSSDAATTLRLLRALWALVLDDTALSELARTLGSDVPFFLDGATALARGRGDELMPLPSPAQTWLVLVVPPLTLAEKTRRMYAALTPQDFGDGSRVAAVNEGLLRGAPLSNLPLWNTFSRLDDRLAPRAAEAEQALRDAGATLTCLCGAGPAWFAPAPSRGLGALMVARLRRQGWRALLTHTLRDAH